MVDALVSMLIEIHEILDVSLLHSGNYYDAIFGPWNVGNI